MVFFRRPAHRFRASPLSLAVPLEGTETVIGLRELQRRKDGYDLARALNLDVLDGRKKAKKNWRKRYKGPYVQDLTLAELKAEPHDWGKISWGLGWQTYNVPESLDHLCERTEENVVAYLPNYLRLLLLLFVISLCLRPWSLLGAAAVAGLTLFKLTVMAPSELRQLPLRKRFWLSVERQYAQAQEMLLVQQGNGQQQAMTQQPAASPASSPDPSKAALQGVLQLLCYVLVIYCNTIGRGMRAIFWWLWLAAAHASLRRTKTELQEAPQNVRLASPGGQPSSTQTAVPGVSFLQVLGLSQREHPDPRRVFREAWQLAGGIGLAAGIYCWHSIQFYSHQAWVSTRSYLPSFLHS